MREDHQEALKKLTLFSDTQRSYKIGSVRLSARPSVRVFLGIISLTFSKFWHSARKPYEVVRDRAGFFGKFFLLPQELGKWTKNGPKTRFFEFVEKVLYLFYDENLYYLLRPCTNSIFGKNFIPKIWAKMFSGNQTAGFFNEPYFHKKQLQLQWTPAL